MPIILYVPEDDEWVEPGPKEWRRHGSGKPPPRPDRPGHWHLYAGSHWLLRDSKKRVPSCWTQSQRAIRWAISYRNRYEVGPINKIQRELLAAVAPIPSESRSRLQEDVFRFATGHLTTTTHPLAPWDQLTQGVRKDTRGVWSEYDTTGYKFFGMLSALNTSEPPTLNQVYMLRLAYAIFSEPGCYAELVSEFHPDAPPDPADDPMNDTILDESREFDPGEDCDVDTRVVIYYLWAILKIPRWAARFNIEPFARLSASVECAVRLWLEMKNPDAKQALPISHQIPMTKREVQTGALFRGKEETPFTCGPFPLRDKSTGAVCWRIPPPAMQKKVTVLELDLSWMKDSDRSEFKARWERRMKALGAFRFM